MAIAEESGATANTTSSSYSGGGAGGKFRKKPFRRQTTPYDRPPTVLRGNNDNNSSWLKKLVVQPASKLISYGASRFFASLLHKRLPPPPPPQPLEGEFGVSDRIQGTVLNSQDGAQEPSRADYSQPNNSSSCNGISEVEQFLKQRTFTRSEIVHLRELLQSRAVEVSRDDVGQKNEDTALNFARHQQSSSGLLEENRNRLNKSSAFMATPILNSKVLEDDNASPAELAKAYIGSRPSKVSPSVLGIRSRVGREASGSPIMALSKKTSNSMATPFNGFMTPRSRGRSAIYDVARTPYPNVYPTSRLKSLKRRSITVDNELGSVGPIRRIRQKPNLLTSELPNNTTRGLGIGSHAKLKLPLIAEPSDKVSKDVGESVPSSSYAHVPSKSSEVASKILQHLENMTPKEKSSECKVARSMKDVDSSNTSELRGWSNGTLSNGRDYSTRKQQKIDVDGPKESIAPSKKWDLVANNDSVVSLKASALSTSGTDSFLKTGPSRPPQKKRFFTTSSQEDLKPTEALFTDSMVAPFEKSKLVKSSIEPADESPSALISWRTREPNPGEVSRVVSLPATEETTTAAQSAVPSLSFAAFDKPKDSINSPTFGFSSKVVENVTSFLPSNSGKEAELKIETPSSSVNVPTSAAFQVKNPEYLLTAGDVNGISDIVPSMTSNGLPHFSSPPPVSFTADSSNDTNQIFKSSDFVSKNSSTSTSTPATTSSDSIFGLTAKTSSLPVFKFDPAASVSAASTTSVSVVAENGSKSEMVQNSGSFSSSVPNVAFVAAASSGSNTFGLGSSVSSPAPANLQASISASASRPFISGMGTGVQDKSTQSLNSSQILNQSNIFGLTPPVTSTEKSALVTSSGPTSSVFKFGTNYTDGSAVSSSTGATTGTFGSGLNSSSNASVFNFSAASSGSAPLTTGAFGSSSASVFNFSSDFAPLTNTATASSLTSGTSSAVFTFGGKSLTSSSSSSAPSNNSLFSSSWQQSPNDFKFGSSSTEFSFAASSSPSTNIFNSFSSGPTFSFSSPSAPVVFGNNTASTFSSGFGAAAAASPDQMNAEDSMAEDPVQPAHVPTMFGQTAPASSVPTMFGQTAPSSFSGFAFGSQPGQSMFGGQQNQVAPPQNPFQATGNVEFNAGGSFSLGSGGGDKSGRKIVKVSRSKNRKK